MRLIDADILKELIDGGYDIDFSEVLETKKALLNMIDYQDTVQSEPHWIPCSERLPEHDGEPYLVTDYCEQINCKRMHISYCYMKREGFWSDVPIGYKVIAWMPLPELYKEVRK